jgi:hypothetical protein
MSRITQISAGILAVAALTAPSAAHAQTSSEKALLNRLARTTYVPNSAAVHSWAASSISSGAVDGERALLARTAAIGGSTVEAVDTATQSTDGAYALLGQTRPLVARRDSATKASR